MQRSAVDKRWNPYTWRLEEMTRLGVTPAEREHRQELEGDLLLAEAREAADGVRHLSIVHGDPPTLAESRHLDEFIVRLKQATAGAQWRRLRGGADHLIVAVCGPDADQMIESVEALAGAMNPGHWRVTPSARPELT